MRNIILIGMPGCGKSTVGVVLAKNLGMDFVDSDLVIQRETGRKLSQLLDEHGDVGFREIENRINAALDVHDSVIATGGSVIYGAEAMAHLREISTVVYLKVSCEELQRRLGDLHARGVTIRPGQTFQDLYEERCPLYEQYAHVTIDTAGKQLPDVVKLIMNKLRLQG